MKKLILFLTIIIVSCHKKSVQPETQKTSTPITTICSMPSTAINVDWKPILTGYINLMFASNGTYYESNYNAQGTWQFKCGDTIKITRTYYTEKYILISSSADSLKLKTMVNSKLIYYK